MESTQFSVKGAVCFHLFYQVIYIFAVFKVCISMQTKTTIKPLPRDLDVAKITKEAAR